MKRPISSMHESSALMASARMLYEAASVNGVLGYGLLSWKVSFFSRLEMGSTGALLHSMAT